MRFPLTDVYNESRKEQRGNGPAKVPEGNDEDSMSPVNN